MFGAAPLLLSLRYESTQPLRANKSQERSDCCAHGEFGYRGIEGCRCHLKLRYCYRITDAGLKVLGHMSNVTDLNLSGCFQITDAGLATLLSNMPTLTSLDLSNCIEVSDAGLKDLGHISSLTTLNLSRCANISDAGRRELIGQLANLTLS